ncbi:hypothetical protein P8452_51310 [Trifolium repens]|nr:hypothetical protein P8452_51310 [Trifolium repens]
MQKRFQAFSKKECKKKAVLPSALISSIHPFFALCFHYIWLGNFVQMVLVAVDAKGSILILSFISRFELVSCFICSSILYIVSFSSNNGAYFGNCIKTSGSWYIDDSVCKRSKPLDLGPIFALLVYPSSHQISQINDHIASDAMDWCDEVCVMIPSTYRYWSVKTLVTEHYDSNHLT